MNISGKIQSLKDIKQTIKSEAGKLGHKLNIQQPPSAPGGKKQVMFYSLFVVTVCGHCLWSLFVVTVCGHCLWSLFVVTVCGL